MSDLTFTDWLVITVSALFVLVCAADLWLTYKGKKLP